MARKQTNEYVCKIIKKRNKYFITSQLYYLENSKIVDKDETALCDGAVARSGLLHPCTSSLPDYYIHPGDTIEAIPPFSVRRIPAFLDGTRYAEPWYAVRQQKCKWYAYVEFCVLQVKNPY